MGILNDRPRLDAEMQAALLESASVSEKTRQSLGLEIVDPKDVLTLRALYNADRAYWNQGGPAMAVSENFSIPGPLGDIPVRLHKPVDSPSNLPVLVFLHGGGWVVGNLDTHDRMARILAMESGWAVLSVDYRLAPEHKFPIPNADCVAAARWVLTDGPSRGLDPSRMAIGGDSAGANLTMDVILQFRDHGLGEHLKAGLLFYGAYGLRDSIGRRLWGSAEDGMSKQDLDFYHECLFATPDQARDPRYDILANDLSDLPLLFVLDVELDPLADDSVALTEIVRAQGGRVRYRRALGVVHGYLHMSKTISKAREHLNEAARFLQNSI